MKKFLLALAFLAVYTLPAAAQVTVPNTFVSGTTILASEVNANFDAVEAQALNRTGGTMTGHLLFSADNTKDIGATGATRPRRGYFGTELIAPLFTGGAFSGTTGTFTGDVQAANLVLTAGGITGVTAFTASGTITGNLFSGSGASLTSIPESAITDGSLLARVGGTETITGAWTFSNAGTAITVSAGASSFQGVSGTTANFSSTVTGGTFSGSGASLTSIPETAITDGAVLARVGGNETISGTWTFSNTITMGSTALASGVGFSAESLGGDWREFVSGTSYPSGATLDKLVPGSSVWYINAYALPGTYAVEGTCKSDTGAGTGYLAVFDLDGGTPDTALTGSEISGTLSTTGVRLRSGAITFPNAVRTLAVKQKASANSISCWGIRIVRIS
jgi:hypothetical protein